MYLPPRLARGAPDQAMAAWVDLWLAERQARGITSVRENRSHWKHHISGILGATHIRQWSAAQLRALVSSLDGKVQGGALAPKTAKNIYGTATLMCDDAHRSKTEALRCRDANPSRDVRGPDRAASKSKQFLYPSELQQFVGCEEVPLLWRRIVAVAVYTSMRAGALRVLNWADVESSACNHPHPPSL